MKVTGAAADRVWHDTSLLSDEDVYLFNEGTHLRLYRGMGARLGTVEGTAGVHFAVWAPNAETVSVIGDFNGWDRASHPLRPRASSGLWEGFVPGLTQGTVYKYHVVSRYHMYRADKADPFALWAEVPPRTASVVWSLDHEWRDAAWMRGRGERNALRAPVSIYEVHLGSWLRSPEHPGRVLGYRDLAPRLAAHAAGLGFTHVELLPVMEHPFYGSWGYQTTGYFAPSSRYGTPQDFMFLIDTLHQAGLGVILDWVPSHFPTDEHGLAYFDGTHLFEHADMRQGFHPDWSSYIFNYGRAEVSSFLLSSAHMWLDLYHADGLRVDAVASMLYLDYSRSEGEWIPNRHGGRENLEAIEFLKRLNTSIYADHPDVMTVAEESTSWPMVSRPVHLGGLGFGMKWDMGWMHDTLQYMSKDPVHRQYHHNNLTFRMLYAYHENFVLPLSHDEVVHGKRSLLDKMPGDLWQKFAGLRLLYGYMFGQPAKKLLFMGAEFGQWREWTHDESLDWHLAQRPPHQGLLKWMSDLNALYRNERAMHEMDEDPAGFEWIDANDASNSVLTFIRRGRTTGDLILVACNFTPVPRPDYRIGVPREGWWRELLNSDAPLYGGSGMGNMGGLETVPLPWHGRPVSLNVTLPPLGAVFFKSQA
jgi:1,4-alpha-glucan branching enzyme